MTDVIGLHGLRPRDSEIAANVTSPPYDVIKPGSGLESRLRENAGSLFHVILGDDGKGALDALTASGALVPDPEPSFYVYEQRWDGQSRVGVFVAAEVSPYEEQKIIRHEKTFDEKVKGRIALAKATGYTTEPIFLLTRGSLSAAVAPVLSSEPLYAFTSAFGGGTDLDGVANRVFRVPADSDVGRAIVAAIAPHPLYIADGHHRYHAALLGGHQHVFAYVTENARILAYNRVINGVRPFSEAKDDLSLEPAERFETPDKHAFCLYTKDGCWTLRADQVPDDVTGRLDCSILERLLYPQLGLEHRHIIDPKHFDYYPENALDEMRAAVDDGRYELAVALHPVSIDELMAVADAGLEDSNIVMPEKSTFFSPKILSGLLLYRYTLR